MPRPPKKQDDKAKVPLPIPMGAPPPMNMMAAPMPQGVLPPPPMPLGLPQGPNGHVVNTEHFLRVRDSVSRKPFKSFVSARARALFLASQHVARREKTTSMTRSSMVQKHNGSCPRLACIAGLAFGG